VIHKEAKSIAPIIVMVLYHGKDPWDAPRSLSELTYPRPDEDSSRYTLNLEYLLHNIQDVPDEKLADNPRLSAVLLVLKYTWEPDELLQVVRDAIIAFSGDREPLETLVSYIMRRLPREEHMNQFTEIVRDIDEEIEPMMEGYALGLIQKGERKGMVKTLLLQLNRRFGTIPPAEITQINTANESVIEVWLERLLDAKSIDEVFGQS
jgi:hypothetical protein